MKKQMYDMTLREIMSACDKTEDCKDCPFKGKVCWDEIRSEVNFTQEVEVDE